MKCETPIDPATKMALTGSDLEAALDNPDAPRCGHELTADDMFCPSCGAKTGKAKPSGIAETPLKRASATKDGDANAAAHDYKASVAGENNLMLELYPIGGRRRILYASALIGSIIIVAALILILCAHGSKSFQFGWFGAAAMIISWIGGVFEYAPLAFGGAHRLEIRMADGGKADAMFNLGVRLYKDGIEVKSKDGNVVSGAAGAFGYFMQAAAKGNARGMYNVASCLEQGIGCEKDKTRALEWYRKAAQNGIATAYDYVTRLEKELD